MFAKSYVDLKAILVHSNRLYKGSTPFYKNLNLVGKKAYNIRFIIL